jgi:hypothetical protein
MKSVCENSESQLLEKETMLSMKRRTFMKLTGLFVGGLATAPIFNSCGGSLHIDISKNQAENGQYHEGTLEQAAPMHIYRNETGDVVAIPKIHKKMKKLVVVLALPDIFPEECIKNGFITEEQDQAIMSDPDKNNRDAASAWLGTEDVDWLSWSKIILENQDEYPVLHIAGAKLHLWGLVVNEGNSPLDCQKIVAAEVKEDGTLKFFTPQSLLAQPIIKAVKTAEAELLAKRQELQKLASNEP